MSEVAKLAVVPIDRTGRPQSDVIALIEDLLARAATGEIQSVALVYVSADGQPGIAYQFGERPSDTHAVATGLLSLQHEFVCVVEQSMRPVDQPTPPQAG